MPEQDIPPIFIQYAADILGDTNSGLSGPNIIKATAAYAVEYGVNIPHPTYPFGMRNKRTALYENLMVFNSQQQYRIIKELCEHSSLSPETSKEHRDLKIKLVTRYKSLAQNDGTSEINETLIEETRHWLDSFSETLSLYNDALEKYEHGVFHRNLLDDLRLALEKLLRAVLQNDKSLENQIKFIGAYVKARGGSIEFVNMFVKLIDYYTNYHNTYVKHDDAVIEEEVEFIFEITSSFMKHLVRLNRAVAGKE
ncbi:MAG TPA: hypothetical protein VMQ63_07885 [Stellaceae bacterium]|jgi:Zn-dependent M32 family carboxypeptidase|nr:hypothetical protein [Stellaceae bacterium]